MKKKILIFIILMTMMFISVGSVFAACDECSEDNCEDCGCVVNNAGTACVYANYDDNMLECGYDENENEYLMKEIPALIPKIVSIVYTAIQIIVPIALVIFGMLDLFKGVTAQKDDEIKKGQQLFIKRLIVAALIFFVFVIVKVLISFVADSAGTRIIKCAECFIENECE